MYAVATKGKENKEKYNGKNFEIQRLEKRELNEKGDIATCKKEGSATNFRLTRKRGEIGKKNKKEGRRPRNSEGEKHEGWKKNGKEQKILLSQSTA